MAEEDFEVGFAWMLFENLFINTSNWHIFDSEQIWFVFAKESIMNELEKGCFIRLVVLFTAANDWLHEELFCFFPDSGVIPSVKLFGIFGQEHVFQVFSEAS